MASPIYGPVERRALQSIATQFVVNGVVFASFLPRLPELRDQIGVDNARLGLLLTIGAAGGFVGSATASPAIERWGTKVTMIGAGVFLVSALPVIGFATHPMVFLAGLLLLGVFDVIVDVAMNMQGSVLSARRSTPVMNRLHGMWSVGTILGGLVAAQLALAGVALQYHLIGVAVALLATLLFVSPGLLTTDDPYPEDPTEQESPSRGSNARPAPRPGRYLVILGLLGVSASIVEMVPNDWTVIRLNEDLGLRPGLASYGFVSFPIGMVVGRLGGDWFQVRIGAERLLAASVWMTAGGLALATLTPSTIMSVVGLLITGLGAASLFPRLYDQAARAPGKKGAALGAMATGQRMAGFFAPATVGFLASTDTLSVGQAMAITTLPFAVLLLVFHRSA